LKPNGKSIKTWSTPVEKEELLSIPCAICGGVSFKPCFSCSPKLTYVCCAKCGLVQINPQPAPAAVALRYGKNYGNDYLAYEKTNEEAFLRLQELALKDAGFFALERGLFSAIHEEASPQAPTVLDIGCASGAMLALLQGRGWKVTGVEISGQQAAYCKSRGLDVKNLPLEENQFACHSFDVVLASHLIEHLNNPGLFIREIKRILKPQGRVYITTPNITGFQARLLGSRWRSAIFDHLYLFSIKTLRLLLETSGFKVERIKTWGGLAAGLCPFPVKRLFDTLAKPLGLGDVMIVRAKNKSLTTKNTNKI
jgi:SAM-dependent methyltransferase